MNGSGRNALHVKVLPQLVVVASGHAVAIFGLELQSYRMERAKGGVGRLVAFGHLRRASASCDSRSRSTNVGQKSLS